jgi:hypothetical protein
MILILYRSHISYSRCIQYRTACTPSPYMYGCILVASKAIGLRQVETRLMNYPCRISGEEKTRLEKWRATILVNSIVSI